MDIPKNKAVSPVTHSGEDKSAKTKRHDKKTVKLTSPDGRAYLTSDLAEAAHLHRAHGYRFDDDTQRESVLSTH
jgi:hypothetical protein